MSPVDLRPYLEEAPLHDSPLHDPRLQAFVDAARAEAPPVVGVDAEAVYAGWQQRRASRRRRVGIASAAAAVLLTAGWLTLRSGPPEAVEDHVVVRDGPASRPPADAPEASETTAPRTPTPATTPVLSASVHVAPLDPATRGAPQVLGPHALRLPDGHWSIDSEASEPVEVMLPDGALRLEGGSVHVQVAGDVVHVEVLREHVLRTDAKGRRITLPLEPKASESVTTSSSPAELAELAERRMAAGDRQGAIRTLRRLVTRHGRSPAAQAGLIDLGRLLKAADQIEEARCAYGMFLARWPGHALAGEIHRARAALGDGPACDGLRPLR